MPRLPARLQAPRDVGQPLGQATPGSGAGECPGAEPPDPQDDQRFLLPVLQQGELSQFLH